MECDICHTEDSSNELICVSCARSNIYLARLEVARQLLENEHLSQQVTSVIEGDSAENFDSTNNLISDAQTTWRIKALAAEKATSIGRQKETSTKVEETRSEIEKSKAEIQKRRQELAARREVLAKVKESVLKSRATVSDGLQEIQKRRSESYNEINNWSTNTRAFLCQEAASLLRLRQKKRMKNGKMAEQYTITGMLLPDLREINNIKCVDLTAALNSVAHLLTLISFYLGVRLPAEITTPHRDYPLPTINTPANSYTGQKMAFPGSGSLSTAPSSPYSSKHDIKGSHRPRTLFIGSDDVEEKVAQFAKRDPMAFNFFVEGIALLAWDIAWLCRCQGFSQWSTSWEDICDIGKNLYQLISSQPESPALLRVLSTRDAKKRQKQSSDTPSPLPETNATTFGKLGQNSHLSAYSFLGQAAFNEQTRGWRYSKYNTIADSLKKCLLTEMNNAEWELLQEQEWDDGGEQFDEAVFIKTRAMDGHEYDDARSIMTTKTHNDEQIANDSGEGSKPKGTSGWTKVKSRDKT